MIRFPSERIVTEWYEVTPAEFMSYLREVRCYDCKYHFYVSSRVNKGMLTWAFELPWEETNFDLCDYDDYFPKEEFQSEIRSDILALLTKHFGKE